MSADTDPTEAIPQVTAEMIAQTAARQAAQETQAATGAAGGSSARPPEQAPAPDAKLPGRVGGSPFTRVEPYDDRNTAAGHIAAGHLSALVQIPTVSSWDPQQVDHEVFARHRAALAAFYPRVHALQSEPAGEHGLLFRWPGRGREAVLHPFPVVLMAHQDVVQADADATDNPFSGEIRDGAVHGRGTLDDKGALVAVLDAVETLLNDGFAPERDIWLFFGADRECAGESAQTAVGRLYELGVRPWLVLDEGGAVVSDAFPGLARQAAVVGVAEKGLVGVELRTSDVGGHSARPVRLAATTRLARALLRVSRRRYAARMSPATATMLRTVAPHAKGARGTYLRLVSKAASGPLRQLAAWVLGAGTPEAAATVRTTVAVTELEGSPAANVAASSARARLEIRVVHGDTVERTVARLRRIVRDKKVTIEVVERGEPTEVSPVDASQLELLTEAIAASYPEALVVPYVTLGATDARTFTPISDHVYRFSPFAMSRDQLQAIHGAGEHLSVDSLSRGVHFYRAVLRKIPG